MTTGRRTTNGLDAERGKDESIAKAGERRHREISLAAIGKHCASMSA
jgi:hypothetical protein